MNFEAMLVILRHPDDFSEAVRRQATGQALAILETVQRAAVHAREQALMLGLLAEED